MLSDKLLDEHLDRMDYYALLGVARDDAAARIRDAFHKFALRFHPDQHMDDPAAQKRALRIFKRGAEGYRVLLDPVLRARYDTALARGEVRLSPRPSGRSRCRSRASRPPTRRPCRPTCSPSSTRPPPPSPAATSRTPRPS